MMKFIVSVSFFIVLIDDEKQTSKQRVSGSSIDWWE